MDPNNPCWDANNPTTQVNARTRLFQMAEDAVPVAQRVFGEGDYLRPMFIQPYKSKNVLIEGITILRSPMWIVHPVSFSSFFHLQISFLIIAHPLGSL